jgi:hypothetical protein
MPSETPANSPSAVPIFDLLGIRDVLWIASLSARSAKPGRSRIAFEVVLHIEGTTKKYQTLILDIGPGTPRSR